MGGTSDVGTVLPVIAEISSSPRGVGQANIVCLIFIRRIFFMFSHARLI